MNAMQKAISQLQKKCTPIKDENDFEYYATNNIVFAMEIAIKEAKKEVFDELIADWMELNKKYQDGNKAFAEIGKLIRGQRHLSNSASQSFEESLISVKRDSAESPSLKSS